MEKPCVVSDIAANAELIEDNKHGYLVPMQNSEALAEGILKLSLNPEQSKVLGKAASVKARRMFDLGLMTKRVEKYMRIYSVSPFRLIQCQTNHAKAALNR